MIRTISKKSSPCCWRPRTASI